MRYLAAILIILFLLPVFGYAQNEPYNIDVKSLYSDPDGNSKLVYEIPIEVKLLDISKDANWYKVYLKFFLGPIEFKSIGWAYIPIGTILAEREKQNKILAIE
ncbi:hypothetical protein A2526_05700 [candidate division WOR-1 bacterium RIFOXYD2_FULL_36_8]|uniref:Uncharacterized protein n=1 Tax=candidate division WOR-1 bacterium RIFOXYB2_FULL_37_13 TaxID=1802579 RepID=A0A1F4SXG5_UNCSA|nr:MAG: hypothetical protein A2246_01065 [candidate division WOR-1 bacterium RIFOXYA2_FULL_37_7]OGC24413.1 MAG: hypothetical protein A2310_08390 [candidate division WOR-1 bacterium RIFOXYB2_FULL_37_13]OGC37491.1 MAG: hypothetical protein A3J90_03425 [candidate division WOR-1 bacterium RIFOXYC2_FULL_37_10]OGC37905.1 MAG: hypothetical protein A2526_05700 [candidate division WOR-1 bacterium RIFOXYD2_FULL_36_8]